MTSRLRCALSLLALIMLLQGCAVSRVHVRQAASIIQQSQPANATRCQRADHCATPSPLMAAAEDAQHYSTAKHPQHVVTLLNSGEAALAARINLIRAAKRSIDLQTYIWAPDDSGKLMLDELVRAAQRGVHVRIIADQLFSFSDPSQLARLARVNPNFQLRLYNPTFANAKTPPLEFAAGIMCCFFQFNQRMHNKVMVVDGTIGITGGRNIEDRYYGWDPKFNYIDRDVMVGGPAAREMATSFQHFWVHKRTKRLTQLRDVNTILRETGVKPVHWTEPRYAHPGRVAEVRRQAEDPRWLGQHILDHTLRVGPVEFFSDFPGKTDNPGRMRSQELTEHIMRMISHAKHQIVLQTPYLVMSKQARRIFLKLHREQPRPRVIVSTNSLASTDAFAVYAMSYKHRKRYLKDYGFEIYELKPHPADMPVLTLPAADDQSAPPSAPIARQDMHRTRRRNSPAPLIETQGMRIGLHAKSIVVDDAFAMVGSHNFDPRSDHYNTEAGIIIYDSRFAEQLKRSILRETQPKNAWTIAPRQPKVPVLTYINQAIGTVSEHLPLFDFWPFRYATSYDIDPGCRPLTPYDPKFFQCYHAVGDFPGVALPFKTIYTRMITAFGVGLSGIL
ncbi:MULTISPECIES: phospholipase D family protein [Oleiagrimonas]|uniref:Phospholipase D family protein n=1 Tax=Oleiagrimonas citrea TaxID=1665687 RepID=A0A846ZRS8_9GAMM|nr:MULTISPECIES: phospholipase D family protein [Oleiagrimonas]NKZ40143.1 phospholipase D family protein [Oleiagrimonas citrea]RAP57068.1 phospholipase [Oleiagrimonas sp. MCCC 1A03011]